MKPELSVVIVTWNRRADLLRALDSLTAQENVGFELVLVDNGSTDGTLEALPNPPFPVRILRQEKNLGACVGRNLGIRACRSDLILFMDSDAVILNKDTLRAAVDRIREDPSIGGLSVPIYLDRDTQEPWLFGAQMNEDLFVDWTRSHRGLVEADALSSCFALVPKRVCEEAGGFDPFYFYAIEDIDFFMTVRELGYRLEVLYGYPIYHRYSPDGRKMGPEFYWHFRQEWRHQYLLLKRRGARGLLRFWGRSLSNPSIPALFYGKRTPFIRFLLLFGILPLCMLALAPLAARRRHVNHLTLGGVRKETGLESNLDSRRSEISPKKGERILSETSPTA